MSILRNEIFETRPSGERLRVLYCDSAKDLVVVISLTLKDTLPYSMSLNYLTGCVDAGVYVRAGEDVAIVADEDALTEKQRRTMEDAWSIIGDFVTSEPNCYNERIRSRFIASAAQPYKNDRKKIQRLLYKYWSGGMTKYALIPQHKNASASLKATDDNLKRGRPATYPTDNSGLGIGLNELTQIEHIIKSTYNKSEKYPMRFAYISLLKTFYYDADANQLKSAYPTYRQFSYHARNFIDGRSRLGDKKFDRTSRAIVGSSRGEAFGPGDKYQIDATIADVYLVSQANRKNIVGRPVLYFVIDVFSRMITGFGVGLEGPSWVGAMTALRNAFMDKVTLCAEYGVTIDDKDWPCHGLPQTLLVDNGELVGKSSNSIIENLGIQVQNHSSWRPDLKGIVEQSFNTLNQRTKMLLPRSSSP